MVFQFDKTHFFQHELSASCQGFGIIFQNMDTPNTSDEKKSEYSENR